jgi:hypothetical protein
MKAHNVPDSRYILVNSQELEAFVAPSSPALNTASETVDRSGFDRLWEFFLNTLSAPAEPKIRRKHDRHGNTYFRVYDPSTATTHTFTSEQEVRAWLDQRYYH